MLHPVGPPPRAGLRYPRYSTGYLYVLVRVRSSCHQGILCRVSCGVTRATVHTQGWRRLRSEASNAMRAKVKVTLVMPRLSLLSASHARGSDLFGGLQ